jgi:glutaredoxin
MRRIGIALAVALAATAAHAQTYKWTDKDGKVNFTDTPPPPGARNVQQRSAAPGPADSGQGSYDLQIATKNFPVVLYTMDACEACKEARDLLVKRGVPFREVSIGTAAGNAELVKVTGKKDVPAMTVGKDVQIGYEPGAYHASLDSAGYPKAPLPGAQQSAAKSSAAARTPAPPAAPQAKADDAPRGRYSPIAPPDAPSADAQKGRYLPQ